MKRKTLSVVLAVKNEERNIGACLESVKKIADEIVIFDEQSTDKTREIATKYSARIFEYKHKVNFHETKQKALEKATGDWILQLDADERVTKDLADEIKEVINLPNEELLDRMLCRPGRVGNKDSLSKKIDLFQKHQYLIEQRDGSIGRKTGEIVAFFLPRVNFFLGKPLKYAGVYPDGAIRLVKKSKARFPAKSVHELMEIDGEVAWLFNDLEHHDSPTLERYLERANRYTDLTAKEYKENKTSTSYMNLFHHSFVKPSLVFLNLYFRHKGILMACLVLSGQCFQHYIFL